MLSKADLPDLKTLQEQLDREPETTFGRPQWSRRRDYQDRFLNFVTGRNVLGLLEGHRK